MVLASTVQSDVGQRALGHLLGEVHRNLTRLNNLALPRLGLEQLNGQVEVIADHLLDVVNAHLAGRVLDKLVDHLLGQIQSHRFAVQAALGKQTDEGSLQFTDVRVDGVSQVFHDLAGKLNAIGIHLLLQDGHPCLQTWHLDVCTQAPLEAGEEALLHALHLHRRLVTGQDNLLARLVKVVEDVEEYVLGFLLSAEELNVVHNEDIHQLVEVREVVDAVVPHGINELVGELLGVHIQHGLFRGPILDLDSNGMGQVGFAQSDRAVNQEGVEGRSTWLLGDSKTCTARKPVALTFNQVFKAVLGIQVGIDVELLEARNHKRILDGRFCGIHGHLHRTVANSRVVRGRQLHGVGRGSSHRLFHDDGILQPRILAQLFANGFSQQVHIVLLQPFVEELRRHLNGQYNFLKAHSLDGNEPRFESLRADIVFYEGEAICPDTFVIQVHTVLSLMVRFVVEKPFQLFPTKKTTNIPATLDKKKA